MGVIYNSILTLLHIIGTVFFGALCMERYIFGLTWTWLNELSFILSGVVIFGVHYVLLYQGHKRKLTKPWVIRILQVVEWIAFLPSIAFPAYCLITDIVWWEFSVVSAIQQELPVLLVSLAVLAIRKVSCVYLYRQTHDNSSASSATESIDPD